LQEHIDKPCFLDMGMDKSIELRQQQRAVLSDGAGDAAAGVDGEIRANFYTIETKAEAVLLPGYQISDMGYSEEGYYMVVLVGKVQPVKKNDSKEKIFLYVKLTVDVSGSSTVMTVRPKATIDSMVFDN
ncbi:MAG: hypothetical protein LJE94_17965, partial [Deltaproteobacteria bacterium]|nr:hypothetical protein [Deltaproteobacteria bacterium]